MLARFKMPLFIKPETWAKGKSSYVTNLQEYVFTHYGFN